MTQPSQPTAVVKESGEPETYQRHKLVKSLIRAGAAAASAERIADQVQLEMGARASSRRLFQAAHRLLRKEGRHLAARYSLKRAIADLGPDGYSFELFTAAILEQQGYETQRSVTVAGQHVTHEIDVVGTKGEKRVLCECKFRRQPGTKFDVKTPLYVYARSLDVDKGGNLPFAEFWLVTNGRFTKDAWRYGDGVGLVLRDWVLPQEGNLRVLIEQSGLHPVTCLTSLRKPEKRFLLGEQIVTCRALLASGGWEKRLELSARRAGRVQTEIEALLQSIG